MTTNVKKSPLATVKEAHGDKKSLVSAVEAFSKNADLWFSAKSEGKGLAHVSNGKLLKLLATFNAVKTQFGTRAKLVSAIADLEKRTKDEGYKARLGGYPVPRLFDMYKSADKRAKAEAAKAAKLPAPAKKAAKAPMVKKPAAKKA